jgi:hypothetical protein
MLYIEIWLCNNGAALGAIIRWPVKYRRIINKQ